MASARGDVHVNMQADMHAEPYEAQHDSVDLPLENAACAFLF
jgi:hypothetical protein